MADASGPDPITRYREAAERTADPDPTVASRAAQEAHELYKLLRATAEGRAALTLLLRDIQPRVRRWAATHCLSWERDAARAVLAELNQETGG